MEVKSTSPARTQKIAANLAKTLKAGDVIALFGNLGVGKTVFVKGIAKGLKIKKKITSPTFVLMRSYTIKISGKHVLFYHLDLFRGVGNDFKYLGLEEIFSQNAVVVLEWADKIVELLPKKRIDVTINAINAKTRKITISRY